MSPPDAKTRKHEFVSLHSVVDESEFALTVGFCRDPADEDTLDGLLLQRGRDATDEIPGIQGVYAEIPIQRHVTQGGITEATLRRNCFALRFDGTTATKMGGLQEILVSFELTDDAFSSVLQGLRFVFQGCACYREQIQPGS